MKEKTLWRAVVLAAALAAYSATHAQAWPARPMSMVVGFAPGGNVDGVARIIGPALAEALGQPVVIENKPGAGGNIGSALVAKAAPDGYTTLLISKGHAASAAIYRKLPYDSVNDYRVAGMLVNYPYIITVPSNSPYPTLKDLVAAARARPATIDYGTGGIGSGMHLGAELMLSELHVRMQHVPYKGGTASQTAMLTGEVPVFFTTPAGNADLHRAGRLRVLAVTTIDRFPGLPDVPTVAETVPGYSMSTWYGAVAPAKVPRDIVQRLNHEMVKALALPDVKERMASLGADVVASSPEETATIFKNDIAKFTRVAHEAHIRAD